MRNVAHYMNPQLVYLQDGQRADIALRPILDFGITAVPVLDEEHRPIGMISLRDLVDAKNNAPHLSESIVTISSGCSVEEAACRMAEDNLHHLVVVGADGRALGMLSSLDVVRALIGMEPKHPRAITAFESPARKT